MSTQPLWWSRAREMHSRDVSLGAIARICGKSYWSVLYVVREEDYRERKRAMARKRTRCVGGDWRGARASIVRAAHDEARAGGRHVDEILIAWGEPARRERMAAQ